MFFFFKQKTAYEMRISDWSSDVCSSDLEGHVTGVAATVEDLEEASVERRASSHFDQLTRLANAASFRNWVSHRLGGRSIYDPAVSVVLIAVSRFDEINAANGRNVGDTLLEAIGRRPNGRRQCRERGGQYG